MIKLHCAAERVKGTEKIGNMWLLPKSTEKPEDGRVKRDVKNGK
jgi:hypothetical protein